RDVCKHKSNEHGHEIFPLVSSLVQYANLNSLSLSLALASINACIKAGVAETRPVWNVLLSSVAKKAMETMDRLVLIQLAGFYSIVAQQSDGSEDFVLFKNTLLFDYIKPLIFPLEGEALPPKDLQKAIISCLAKFEPSEIFPILPDTPRRLVDQIVDAPNDYHELLLTLMRHEIQFMRRTMFKGTMGKGGHKGTASGNEKLFESLTHSGVKFTEAWEGGKVLPGLRVGYALASLFCFGFISDQEKAPFSQVYPDYHAFKSSKPYRFLTDGIQDISLTDHLVTRLSVFEAWFSLFSTTFEDTENDGTFDMAHEAKHKEIVMNQLVADLLERLANSRVPKTSCNIIAALTGLIRNMHNLNSSSATTQTRLIIDHFKNNIIDQSTSQSVTDDILFSVNISIAILTSLIPSDEKLLLEISRLLITGLQAPTTVDKEWAQFGCGYGLGIIIDSLYSLTSISESTANLRVELLHWINGIYSPGTLSTNVNVGIIFGLGRSLAEQPEIHNLFFNRSLGIVEDTLNEDFDVQDHSLLASSLWTLAVVGSKNPRADVFNLLKRAADVTKVKFPSSNSHSQWSYAYLLYSLVQSRQSSASSLPSFYSQINMNMQSIATTASKDDRLISVISLCILLGMDFFAYSQDALRINISKINPEIVLQILQTLSSTAGLNHDVIGDIKGTRIAAVILGRVVYELTVKQTESVMAGAVSTEPPDYSRFPAPTSYLRAAFEGLTESSNKLSVTNHNPELAKSILTLLRSYTQLESPIPPVNWYPLHSLTHSTLDLQKESIQFAATHCLYSSSLVEFLISLTRKSVADQTHPEIQTLLFSPRVLGQLLNISGLVCAQGKITWEKRERRASADLKKVVLPASRILELVEILIRGVFEMRDDQILRRQFLTTLGDYLQDYPLHATKVNSEVSGLYEDLLGLLRPIYSKLSEPTTVDEELVIKEMVRCSLFTLEDVDRFSSDTSLHPRKYVLSVCTLVELQRAENVSSLVNILKLALTLRENDTRRMFLYILQTLYSTTQEKSEQLDWIVRILDVLIILSSDGVSHVDLHVLSTGMAWILGGALLMWWDSSTLVQTKVINSEKWNEYLESREFPWEARYQDWSDNNTEEMIIQQLSFLLAEVVLEAYQRQRVQQQIIKRLITLLTTTMISNTKQNETFAQVQIVLRQILEQVKVCVNEEDHWILIGSLKELSIHLT
ncbi:hypothetical protein K7432_012622, partial [Basidiobolus ranarum]